MVDSYFIEDQRLVKKLLANLQPTGNQTGYYAELYVDPVTGQEWEKYEFEYEDSSTDAVGLRKFPYPSTDKIIEIALFSPHDDEASGAAGLLLELEDDENDFREKLLDQIENNIDRISEERYDLVYWRAQLYDIDNKKSILGKHISEIESDAAHYNELSKRAKQLKQKIK